MQMQPGYLLRLENLSPKKDELAAESDDLRNAIKELQSTLVEMTDMREGEHNDNMETLKTAKDGLKALKEAIATLEAYYKSAQKNDKYHSGELEKVALVQVSPVDIDEENPGVAQGAYKGQQGASKGVIGMLQTIETDFEHTIATTTADEKEMHTDFVEASSLNKVATKKKETKLALDVEDLAETNANLESKYGDLTTAQDLLDGALKELEKLRPICVDSGMAYTDRQKQREEEICALKWAHNLLLPIENRKDSIDGCSRA